VRELPSSFRSYTWAPSDREIAALGGIDPSEVLRFDANVPAYPPLAVRPSAVAGAVATVNTYPHGGYQELVTAIARYAGVDPKNVVLGAGSDDLILLVARSFGGPGGRIDIANDPTYPMFDIARALAGAERVTGPPELTFFCRPNNPTGEESPLPAARPLVVDEAYFEYSKDTVADRLDDDIIVLRTFSKAFGLAGARVGYALAAPDVAAELNRRQSPAPVSTLSAALALAALETPPDVTPELEERARLEEGLQVLGFSPLPSVTNFVYVPVTDPPALRDSLYSRGLAVRAVPGGVRISVRDELDDDVLLAALAAITSGAAPAPARNRARRVRRARATAETRIAVTLQLDGGGSVHIATGSGLYDHFLEQLGFHAGFDATVSGSGDRETGSHHTVEDTAITFGETLDRALGDRSGIARYGDAVVAMDDALATAAVDLGGRAWAEIDIHPDPGLAVHSLTSLAQAARMTLHVTASGSDAHHVAEASFKAVGRALKKAISRSGASIPSTKGIL
jgi:histidinol-phosphate/aromatic aminotransferase/cobyric acid decarboxylase-like protein/imidazoleglycerol phosphate dehydratase HisB